MRWIRYEQSGKVRHGILDEAGDRVAEVQGGLFDGGTPTGQRHAFADVKLLPPVIPPTFYAAGLNYMTHIRRIPGRSPPPNADIGYRANNALIASGEDIVVPGESAGVLQAEGELVLVVGKKVKHVSEDEAMGCVFGYSIGNDVSERVWQKSDRTLWRAKNSDTFKPMGPWIETEGEIDKMYTRIRINGKEVASFPTNDMVFSASQFIASMTRVLTLYPGDVIWMGTDEPTPDMRAGDLCEVEITGVGTLSNRLVAER
ncbi:MAG: fumarylacetoacetate hydrolase family protein [Lautropia sp.]